MRRRFEEGYVVTLQNVLGDTLHAYVTAVGNHPSIDGSRFGNDLYGVMKYHTATGNYRITLPNPQNRMKGADIFELTDVDKDDERVRTLHVIE